MSAITEVETGILSVYDSKGRTYIPDNIKEAMDLGKGDKIKLVYEDGKLRGEKVTEDEER